MKKIFVCIILLPWHALLAQQTTSTTNTLRHPGAPPGFVGEKHPPVSQLQNFVVPKRINSTSYSATFYTFNDIAVFSYFDSTHITITVPADTTLIDTILNADTFDTLSPGNGIYTIIGDKPFTALTGDAITSFASGYFAVDQNGSGVSTKLNTWMMKGPPDFDPHFILFSYDGQTNFSLKDLATGALLYVGSVDTTGYFDFPNVSLIQGKAIQVTSDKPVSALSYTDQGYYVPSSTGAFAGNMFLGFSGYVTGEENSITLTSYSDNNVVAVTNLTTGDTMFVDTLNHWQVKTIGNFKDTFWKVSSTGILTAGDIPFAGWGAQGNSYYYLTQCADSTGKNIGTSFVLPTIAGDMEIFSSADNNEVRVVQLGDTSYPYQSPVQVKDTVLQNGGVCVLNTPSGYNVFRVESQNGVSVVQSFGGGGAAFVPINNAAVNLPDLTIGQSDISFLPVDSNYQTGQTITVELKVHNFGTIAASNIPVAAYDGNPDLGSAPVLMNQNTSFISAGGTDTLSFQMIVPPGPEYHLIYVKLDPNNLVTESNKSNNEAFKYLLPKKNIGPRYDVYFSAPGALRLQGGTLAPNPFSVTADIFNATSDILTNPDLNIGVSVSNGLEILSGVTDTTIVSFPGTGHLVLNWNLQANKDSSGFGVLRITLLRQYVDTTSLTVGILIPDTVSPPVPEGLAARTDSSGPRRMMLTWTPDSTRDIAGYKIYYSTDSTNLLAGTGANQGSSPIFTPNADTFIVVGLTNGVDYWFAISAFDFSSNESPMSQAMKVLVLTKAQQQGGTPKTFALFQNFPNPFNPTTTINYQLPINSHVTLRVYDILGREVATLVNAYEPAGDHQVTLDASKLASGVYFYKISAGDFNEIKKFVVLK